MKRTFATSAIAVALGCALAVRYAGAQVPADAAPAARSDDSVSHPEGAAGEARPSERRVIDVAKEEVRNLVQRTEALLRDGPADNRPNDRQAMRGKLRPLVEEAFDARQRLQQEELKELRHRLGEIEQAIRQRETNKQAIIDARIEGLLDGPRPEAMMGPGMSDRMEGMRPGPISYPGGQMSPGGMTPFMENKAPTGSQDASGAQNRRSWPGADLGDVPADEPRAAASDGEFDLETRERLAELDVHAAEEDFAAAEQTMATLQRMSTVVGAKTVQSHKKEHRQAKHELQRAKIKLEGLARQRAEMEAAAEAAVAEADADVQSVRAKYIETNERTEADVEAAKANLAFRQKEYDRKQKLFEVKSIDASLLDEAEQRLATAKAALDASSRQSKAAINEAQAGWRAAQLRLGAAQARRDRLIRRRAEDKTGPQDAGIPEAKSNPAQPSDSREPE